METAPASAVGVTRQGPEDAVGLEISQFECHFADDLSLAMIKFLTDVTCLSPAATRQMIEAPSDLRVFTKAVLSHC